MRKPFVIALLLALAGSVRAEAGAPPAAPEKPARARKASPAPGARSKADAPPSKQKPGAKPSERGQPAQEPASKPCEPVKPCPID